MPTDDDRKLTAEEFKTTFGAPPLIRGESEEAYWKWWNVFVEQYQPENLSDWLDVDQLAIDHWVQARVRRCNPALVEGVLFEALRNLLRPFCLPAVSDSIQTNATHIARDYYLGDDEDREEAREKVQTWGITDDQILAEAMQIRGQSMVLLDRLDNHRTNSKRKGQKELDRRSQARRNPPQSGSGP